MGKNNIIFITIDNTRKDYFNCMHYIDLLLDASSGKSIDFKGLSGINSVIKKYNAGKIIPAKIEEPLQGDNISSSLSDVLKVTKATFDKIHFHIRVNLNNSGGAEKTTQIHYLALLLEKFSSLVKDNRLSVFLMPDTGVTEYPFYDKTNIENDAIIKNYQDLSAYLRLIIREDLYGVIYSVSHVKKDYADTIIQALDFKLSKIKYNSAPLIVFKTMEKLPVSENDEDKFDDDCNEPEDSIEKVIGRYINSDKYPGVSNESDINVNLLDNYRLLFHENIVDSYLEKIFNLNTTYRFGFSKNKNAKIALGDYIFETAFKVLLKKFNDIGLNIKDYRNEIKNTFVNTNIFCFVVFAYLFCVEQNEFENNLKSYSSLAKEISEGVSQLIQNSLQHASSHFCAVSLFVKENNKTDNNLIIKITDLSDLDICETFFQNIELEKKHIESILLSKHEKYNICNLRDSYREISDIYKKLEDNRNKIYHEMFYNEFVQENTEGNTLWKEFRRVDSSAHIGLALFSQTIKKCGGSFVVTAKNNQNFTNGIFTTKCDDVFYGTDYEIVLPIKPIENIDPSVVTKVSFNDDITENYKSYAHFLDYDIDNKACEKFKSENTIAVLKQQKKLNLNYSIEKFLNQFIWTRFWLTAFNEINDYTKVYNFDLAKIFGKANLYSDLNNEMIIKGLINAVDVYSKFIKKVNESKKDILFSFVNINRQFFYSLKNLTVSLALKNFPENVQLFFVYEHSDKKTNSYIHLIGDSYGEAVCNSFNLAIENGSRSYSNEIYYNVMQMITRLEVQNSEEECERNITTKYVFPFTSFIEAKNGISMFFNDIKKYAEKKLLSGEGYKLPDSHMRLGNKVHINSFYEMSFIFFRTIVANRIAFDILRKMRDLESTCLKDVLTDTNLLFLGYASYSEAILISITTILKEYRSADNSHLAEYALYQYNLRTESKSEKIEIQMSNEKKDADNVYVIQIVPISSTMTTFEKIWTTFQDDCEKKNRNHYRLLRNYSAFWVGASEDSCIKEEQFYTITGENVVKGNNLKSLSVQNVDEIHYIISGSAKWQNPEYCDMCYPNELINEKPLVETDQTSTVPALQIQLKQDNAKTKIDADLERISRICDLYGFVHYGHYVRGKNHYQFYVETQKYFTKYSDNIKKWLKELRENNKERTSVYPRLNIIFSPEHNTNVGFSQFVNTYYFNGNAEIVSINEDKEFRTNFVCEFADLKSTIERLWNDYASIYDVKINSRNMPVRFFFADDTIVSGETFYKANSFLQSLIPDKYRHKYNSNVFEKCFILVDRLSEESRKSFVFNPNDYHSYCHIDISNMRKQGDSCTCCKCKNDAQKFFRRSATNRLAEYWKEKCIGLEEKSYEKIPDETANVQTSYLKMVMSHIVKNLLRFTSSESKSKIIINLFGFFVNKITGRSGFVVSERSINIYLEKCWKELIEKAEKNNKPFDKNHVLESLIKIITRPFFIYDYDFKAAVLKFTIVLSEKMINEDYQKNDFGDEVDWIVENINNMYSEKSVRLSFFENVLFEAFSDLRSTYLIRKQTMDNLKKIIYSSDSTLTAYTANVQRALQGSSDETRTVRFEQLLLFGEDSCSKKEDSYNNNYFESNLFKEIFLLNGHLYFEDAKRFYEDDYGETQEIQDKNTYYLSRLQKIRRADNRFLFGSTALEEDAGINEDECQLYKLLHEENDKESNTIKKRYERLLERVRNMISHRYRLSNNDLKIAILTLYNGERSRDSNYKMSDLQVIKMLFPNSKSNVDRSNFKYIVKERILEYRKEYSNIGYSIISDNKTPYFIIHFDNMVSKDEEDKLNVGRYVRSICPVYLYIEIDTNTKDLLWFVMRDILSYRDSILRYLEYDFTSDVLSEYARLTLTESIFNVERAISHTSMISDLKELNRLFNPQNVEFKEKSSPKHLDGRNKIDLLFTREVALKWAYAKNYSNKSIAKLYNYMMTDINKDVYEIYEDKLVDPMSSKLYLYEGYKDGISLAASKISRLLPCPEREGDYIFDLFDSIVNFECDKKLKNAEVYLHNYQDKKITYNEHYLKCIIYRIIFDALDNCPDVHDHKFVDNLMIHYRNMTLLAKAKSIAEDNMLKSLVDGEREMFRKCLVKFFVEDSSGLDFNWLVIENTLESDVSYKMKEIYRRLKDPIDYNDGHISTVAINEYVCKLHHGRQFNVTEMFRVVEENGNIKFITKLPIIRKEN